MTEFQVGDRVKVLDKSIWPDGGDKIARWEGKIVEVIRDPAGYVMMKGDSIWFNMLFHEKELEKIQYLL